MEALTAQTDTPAAAALRAARTVVVKAGSALVADADSGAADASFLWSLARDCAGLMAEGRRVAVVSSGAVALGRRRLGLTRKVLTLPEKQACAAAGQAALMSAWEAAFAPFDRRVAQLLLTREDTERRRRWLNARAAARTLSDLGAVPVVNENDTVATEEIRYGDNDRLAARVAQMLGADVLVLLSDVDGFYDGDPRSNPSARRFETVAEVDDATLALAGGANAAAGVGSGGMRTKLEAARIAGPAGCATIVTLGRRARPLADIVEGAAATLFEASTTPERAYKAWIAGAVSPSGALVVDTGAAEALARGRSLLCAGVRETRGRFDRGDTVAILGPDGSELARGVSAYADADARRVAGLRSDAIVAALGWEGPAEIVHRDDMVVTGRKG